MGNRSPFENLPPGCPPLDFDVNIVPNEFTLCSFPPVTSLSVIPLDIVADLDSPVPPFCPCLPTLVATCSLPTIELDDTKKPYLSVTMWNATADCCEPLLTMQMKLGIPCLPLELSGEVTKTIRPNAEKELSLYMELTRRPDTCALTYNLDLKIPCMPLDLSGEVTSTIRPNDEKELSLFMELTKRPDTCALTYNLDLRVPCMPLELSGEVTSTIRPNGEKELSMYMELTKRPDTCALTYNMDLKIPCMPLTIVADTHSTVYVKGTPNHPVTYTLELTKMTATCGLQHRFELCIPCLPLKVTSRFTGTVLMNIQRPRLLQPKVLTRKETPTCQVNFDMGLCIPCLPQTIDSEAQMQIGEFAPPNGAFDVEVQKQTGCKFKLNYDLKIPCIPFKIVQTICPVAAAPGMDTVCILVEQNGCSLKFKAKFSALGYMGCVTYLDRLTIYGDSLQQVFKQACYTVGRLYTVKDAGTEEIIKFYQC